MAAETENLMIEILQDLQSRMGRIEDRMANIELRMTAQEQHLGAMLMPLPAGQDRLDTLTLWVERIECRLELADG